MGQKYLIDEETLTNLADATRSKSETVGGLSPEGMAETISDLTIGNPFTFNTLNNFDVNGGWDGFITRNKDLISTEDLISASSAFNGSSLHEIPFELNWSTEVLKVDTDNMFNNSFIEVLPDMNGIKIGYADYMLNNCNNIEELDDDFANSIDYSYWHNNQDYIGDILGEGMGRLKSISPDFVNNAWALDWQGYKICNYNGNGVKFPNLKAINNLPVVEGLRLANSFEYSNGSIESITFEPVDSAAWTSASITLYSPGVDTNVYGYLSSEYEITDDESYERLKANPNRWTRDPEYATFDLASARELIASLPDCIDAINNEGGYDWLYNTLTIDGGLNGNKTDGGAICDLTDAEKQAAYAKGWNIVIIGGRPVIPELRIASLVVSPDTDITIADKQAFVDYIDNHASYAYGHPIELVFISEGPYSYFYCQDKVNNRQVHPITPIENIETFKADLGLSFTTPTEGMVMMDIIVTDPFTEAPSSSLTRSINWQYSMYEAQDKQAVDESAIEDRVIYILNNEYEPYKLNLDNNNRYQTSLTYLQDEYSGDYAFKIRAGNYLGTDEEATRIWTDDISNTYGIEAVEENVGCIPGYIYLYPNLSIEFEE